MTDQQLCSFLSGLIFQFQKFHPVTQIATYHISKVVSLLSSPRCYSQSVIKSKMQEDFIHHQYLFLFSVQASRDILFIAGLTLRGFEITARALRTLYIYFSS